jgi:hypothetical protein
MTIVGKILLLLNLIAAALFALLAMLDYSKRLAWTHAVSKQDEAIEGLPIEDQRKELEALKDPKGNTSFFAAVNGAAKKYVAETSDKKEGLKSILYPLAVDWKQLDAYQNKVKNIKDDKEKQAVLLEDAAKRWMLAQVLLPLEEFRPLAHREKLAVEIGNLTIPYKNLEKKLVDRINELLRPQAEYTADQKGDKDAGGMVLDLISVEKPGERVSYHLRYQRIPEDQKVKVWFEAPEDDGEAKKDKAEKGKSAGPAVNPNPLSVKLSNVEEQPTIELSRDGAAFSKKDEAFKANKVLRGEINFTVNGKQHHVWFSEREPVDYRQALAYMLFSLAGVMTPEGKPLGAPTEQRVEQLVGRKILPHAIDMQTKAFEQTVERRLVEIDHDFDYFVERYHVLVKDRLPYMRDFIAQQTADLERVKKNLTARQKHLEDREDHLKVIEKQVQAERKKATAALADLARWQQRLFTAQKKGAGVAEENQRLERKIRKLETGR